MYWSPRLPRIPLGADLKRNSNERFGDARHVTCSEICLLRRRMAGCPAARGRGRARKAGLGDNKSAIAGK